MSVFALQVSERRRHPNADNLYVYSLTGPNRTPVQVIGNDDAVYQPGEIVAVAVAGALLTDGTLVRPIQLRGVESAGMLLERVEHAPGSDLSQSYCAPDRASTLVEESHAKWASVELLHNVRRGLEVRRSDALAVGETYVYPKVHYRAKVKLDGTNGGVQILPNGRILAQSRSRLITSADDNMGFAAWVDDNRSYFESIDTNGEQVIVFGEWCGQGIQKRTAISKVTRRLFVVFAVQFGHHHTTLAKLEVEPERIRSFLPEHDDVYVLPWHGVEVTLDFGDRITLERSASIINEMVTDVEDCDPWVAEIFGVRGLGEGVVMYPQNGADGTAPGDMRVIRETYTSLMFKAKGDKHQVVKQKKPAQLEPERAANVAQFVELFVTPQRLDQAVTEGCSGAYDMRQMGSFLKWIGQDIKKESAVELEASGLEWKDVSKAVTTAARNWYKAAVERV